MEIFMPRAVGKEIVLYKGPKGKNSFGSAGLGRLLRFVDEELEGMCKTRLRDKSIALFNYDLLVIDAANELYLVHALGGSFLNVRKPSRKEMIEDFSEYYKMWFKRGAEDFLKIGEERRDLEYRFEVVGYRDSISEKMEIRDIEK